MTQSVFWFLATEGFLKTLTIYKINWIGIEINAGTIINKRASVSSISAQAPIIIKIQAIIGNRLIINKRSLNNFFKSLQLFLSFKILYKPLCLFSSPLRLFLKIFCNGELFTTVLTECPALQNTFYQTKSPLSIEDLKGFFNFC